MNKTFSIKKAYAAGWRGIWSHFWLIASMILTIELCSALFTALGLVSVRVSLGHYFFDIFSFTRPIKVLFSTIITMPKLSLGQMFTMWWFQLIGSIISLLLSIGFIKSLLALYDKKVTNYKSFLLGSFDLRVFIHMLGWIITMMIISLVVFGLSAGIIMIMGMLAGALKIMQWLTVGIVLCAVLFSSLFLIRLSFAGFFIIDQRSTFIAAMKQSYSTIRGITLKLFALWVISVLCLLLPALIIAGLMLLPAVRVAPRLMVKANFLLKGFGIVFMPLAFLVSLPVLFFYPFFLLANIHVYRTTVGQ